MDVVGHDADLDHTSAVASCLGQEEGCEKIRHRLIDEWQAGPTSPGEVGVNADGHDSRLRERAREAITK